MKIFKILKNLKDPKKISKELALFSPDIFFRLKKGENLFEILEKIIGNDKIINEILKIKNLESLRIIGEYGLYKKKFEKDFFINLIYPIIISLINCFYFYKLIFFFLPFFLFIIFLNKYLLYRSFKKYVSFLLFKAWVKKQITFSVLENTFAFKNLYDPKQIFNKITNENFINLDLIESELSIKFQENKEDLKNIKKYLNYFSIFIVGVILSLSFILEIKWRISDYIVFN